MSSTEGSHRLHHDLVTWVLFESKSAREMPPMGLRPVTHVHRRLRAIGRFYEFSAATRDLEPGTLYLYLLGSEAIGFPIPSSAVLTAQSSSFKARLCRDSNGATPLAFKFQRICQRYCGASQYSTIFTRLKRSLGESLVLLNSTSDASVGVHKIMSTTIYRVEHCNHDHLFITSIFGSIRTSNDIRSGSSTPSLSFRSPYPLSQSPTLLDFIDVASSGVACGLTCVESYRS